MKNWQPNEIKSLRLRLGWSAAEFGRRFGCTSDLVLNWEKGAESPSPDDVRQLQHLEFHAISYCQIITNEPQAEIYMATEAIEQVHKSQIPVK